jgi:hypothetical protein
VSGDGFYRDHYQLAHEELIRYAQLRGSIRAWLDDPRASATTKVERIRELVDQFEAAERAQREAGR